MKNFLKNNWQIIILMVLAILTRFLFLWYPSEVVFDEVHFGKFVSSYFTHEYYFDIHPPLGKLLIAGFSALFGFSGGFDFQKIGEAFNAQTLFILRFLPALFGVLLIFIFYKLVFLLTSSKKLAFLAGFLICFENAILIESKFILVDIFLLFFGFLSLYLLFLGKAKNKLIFYVFSAITAGLAFSIKWTGLSFLGIIFVYLLFDAIKNKNLKQLLIKAGMFIFVPIIIYFSIFAIHFALLNKSGSGDAYMNNNFWQKNVIQKTVELNQKMYFYSSTLKATHPYSSKWYQWPRMEKSIWYWTDSINSGQANFKRADIYFVGNIFIWFVCALSTLWTIFYLFLKKFKVDFAIPLFFIGYWANLLPFIFISRATFLYHYLPALSFGIILFILISQKILNNNKVYFAVLILIVLFFLFFLPTTYGFFISPELINFYKAIF